ncbi:O-antigen ligase family protein [Myxococcaceae bacterium GXIMD 01537]
MDTGGTGPLGASNARGPVASRWLAPLMVVAVTFAVWPTAEAAFTPVKTGVLVLAAGALLARAALGENGVPAPLPYRVLAGLWPATLALSSLLAPLAPPGGLWLGAASGLVLLALLQSPVERTPVLRAIAGAGTALAAVAALQALGLDVFNWWGWRGAHPGERMRVYGTLGNPDFVASFLGASLCLTAGEALSTSRHSHRWAWACAAALQVGALAATRSFASLLALGAAVLTLAWTRPSTPSPTRGGRRWALPALGVLALLLLVPWGRSLGTALEGRRYLLNVSAPHLVERPVLGHGPDSFVTLWPAWEADYWAAGAPDSQRRFAAPQNHAHNDYLEWLLELGLLGAAPRVLLVLAALLAGRHAVDTRDRATTAALAALAARALVDFPLSRPDGLCLLAVLVSVSLRRRSHP